MSETIRLLRGIMKTSGWTQEQVATKLGVSYPTMNAWVNGKSKPRQAMLERIRKLYLAQDITKDMEPTYVTLVNVPRWIKVDDMVLLEKDYDNSYDDEAILATILEVMEDDYESESGMREDLSNERTEDESIEVEDETSEAIKVWGGEALGCPEVDFMYVANSINTVVRGTSSAGRIYDKFGSRARARVLFVFHKMAIARVVEWNYAEEGE